MYPVGDARYACTCTCNSISRHNNNNNNNNSITQQQREQHARALISTSTRRFAGLSKSDHFTPMHTNSWRIKSTPMG
jgi:hypothetical protein